MPTSHFIIVNYNAGDWLLRSTMSALGAGASRVTVIDNASVDDSVAKVKQNPNSSAIEWVENTENIGFAAANNLVLRSIDTDYAVLLNPDCEIPATTLSAILEEFAQRPRMALASCRIEDEDGLTHATSKRRFPTPLSALGRMLKLNRIRPDDKRLADFDYASDADKSTGFELVEAVSGAFMVVRAEAINEVGLLDEAYFMHCEDLDWCMRFRLADWQVGYHGGVFVTHAKGVSSRSRPFGVLWNLHRGMARFFDKFYQSNSPFWLRWLVKMGILASFVLRVIAGFAANLLRRGQK